MATEMTKEASISGLTAAEAKEFHGVFMLGFIVFTVIAIIAHFLVWQWRPWIPGPSGYSMLEHVQGSAAHVLSLLA